jgi:hypothetical protein
MGMRRQPYSHQKWGVYLCSPARIGCAGFINGNNKKKTERVATYLTLRQQALERDIHIRSGKHVRGGTGFPSPPHHRGGHKVGSLSA